MNGESQGQFSGVSQWGSDASGVRKRMSPRWWWYANARGPPVFFGNARPRRPPPQASLALVPSSPLSLLPRCSPIAQTAETPVERCSEDECCTAASRSRSHAAPCRRTPYRFCRESDAFRTCLPFPSKQLSSGSRPGMRSGWTQRHSCSFATTPACSVSHSFTVSS